VQNPNIVQQTTHADNTQSTNGNVVQLAM